MPSLTDRADRHVIIDRRLGRYLSFPDVGLDAAGNLVVVHREAEEHVAEQAARASTRSRSRRRPSTVRVTLPRS